MIEYAKSKSIKKILLASSGTNIAVKFMSQVCKGNGHNIPNIISPRDNHIDDIEICKPLIDLLKKEIMFYLRIKDLD